ncbi:MAG: hypothetical protein AAF390_13200 [Pseudomonadota bacterium]
MSDDLTGRWIGRYAYAAGGAPVPFEVDLLHRGDLLDGKVTEPNTFRHAAGPELVAAITGRVADDLVTFTKRYIGLPDRDHPRYEGRLAISGNRIAGTWRLDRPGWLTGSFTMARKPRAAARAARRAAAPA